LVVALGVSAPRVADLAKGRRPELLKFLTVQPKQGDFAAGEEPDMSTLSSNLLRTGLALKLGQIKLATRSYLRDRTHQATSAVGSYAIATGLSAAAGLFLIAACLVGTTALFRWIEINYGLFPAFGAIGALLLVCAVTCAAFAVSSVRRAQPQFPSLTSRLRVAITASPLHSGRNPTAQEIDSAALISTANRIRKGPGYASGGLPISAGLILATTLLGWAAARRRQQARRSASGAR
jgi:hypothetical protein